MTRLVLCWDERFVLHFEGHEFGLAREKHRTDQNFSGKRERKSVKSVGNISSQSAWARQTYVGEGMANYS